MGRVAARFFAATVLGISLLAGLAGQASASGSAETAGQMTGQVGAATVHGSLQALANAQSGGAIVPGFNSETYGPNDDGSAPCTGQNSGVPEGCTPAPVSLPFVVNYFGTRYDSVYLNNNGNVTFGAPLSQYTPESLNQINVPMIAPFWADVDTRAGSTVTYGDGTVGGHIAFGVNWLNVGCFDENNSVSDAFQLLLIQRPDLGVDDWDIEYNYGPLTWDSGQASGGDGQCLNGTSARAGYTSGAGVSCEFDGSGENGALLSDDPETGLSNNSFDSSVTGRYVDQVAGSDGTPNGCGRYWALGDSYSSGEGTGLYNLAGSLCDRSTLGWPEDLSAGYPAVPQISPSTYVACSGDTTQQILNGQPTYEPVSQVDQLRNSYQTNGEPGLVTATGGGNDPQVGFGDVLSSCVEWGTLWDNDGSHCIDQVLAQTLGLKNGGFTPILKNYYTQIVLAAQGKATMATPSGGDPNVVIVGYPDLFPAATAANATEARTACPWMGTGALAILKDFAAGQAELNTVMKTAATQAGVRFVNLGDPLVNHELCTAQPDILALTYSNGRHAGHPNAAGQQLIADKVASVLGYLAGQGSSQGVSGNVGRASSASAAGQAKRPGTGRRAATSATAPLALASPVRAQQHAVAAAPAAAVALGAALPQGGVGAPYDGYLWATGGTAPYTFSVTSGSLPAGLTIDPTGVITGTPTAAGTATFTVTATDASSPPQTASASETIDVLADPALAVSTAALPSPTVGQEYDATLAATGGLPDYTWAVTSGSLPAGLSLDASTGEISGQPTSSGPSAFTVQVTDSSTPTAQTATKAITMTVVAASATLATAATTLPGASVGDTYDETLRSTGGTGPVSWSVTSGTLPTGLTLDPATGEITGVATEAGAFAFTAQVQDAAAHTATENLSITIANGTPLTITSTTLPDGTQGAAYDQVLTADGGVAPYVWSVSTGSLPAGVSLNPATGEITGTPTTSGSFAFTVTASDSAATAQTATQNLTLTIAAAPPPPAMTLTDTAGDGTIGTPYQAALIPANGTGPYTFSVTSGALPGGLTLNPNTGVISGTPTTAGTVTAAVTATDSSVPANTATDSLSIVIAAPAALAVATTSLPNGAVGALYATQVAVTGGFGADTFAVTSGSLPAGLALDPATGIINGTPTAAGASTFTVTVTDSATPTADTATGSLTLTIGSATPLSVTTTSLPDAQQDILYSQILTATGGAPPYTWSVSSGSLPAGLSLSSSTGVISGTPTGTGASTFTVQVTDSLTPTAQNATAPLTLTVDPGTQLGITTAALPDATQGAAYTATVNAGGGTAPYTWSVSSGSLPAGLTLDPGTGEISGTPTGSGPSTFTVQVTDSSTPPAQVSQQYTINVAVSALTPQAIAFTAPSSGTVGGTATLTATGGGSGNPVVFTVDGTSGTGACTVSGTNGTTVHYTGAGSCVIDANQAGNASYSAAPQAQGTISVVKAAQAISFTAPSSGTVGGTATLTATGGGSGNPVVFTVDAFSGAGVCAVSGANGSTVKYTVAGSCVIDANQAGNASYTAAPQVTQTITVNQGPAFVTDSPPLTAVAGQPYDYTFTASGTPAPTYALASGAPSWLSINASTGEVTGTPRSGTTSFRYTVTATNRAGTATAGPYTVTLTKASSNADISATLSCPASMTVGHTGTCTLTVANAGPATASKLVALVPLPPALSEVSCTLGCARHANVFTWTLAALARGTSVKFAVTVRASAAGRILLLGAAASRNPDPRPLNNISLQRVTIRL